MTFSWKFLNNFTESRYEFNKKILSFFESVFVVSLVFFDLTFNAEIFVKYTRILVCLHRWQSFELAENLVSDTRHSIYSR